MEQPGRRGEGETGARNAGIFVGACIAPAEQVEVELVADGEDEELGIVPQHPGRSEAIHDTDALRGYD